jgi:hypothetical protein
MTNMDMPAVQSGVNVLGNGNYRVYIYLDMAGPWAITIQASANGFAPQQRTVFVQAIVQ